MYLKNLLKDLSNVIMINDDNELFILIHDDKYLVIKLLDEELTDYLDISDIIDSIDDSRSWKIMDLSTGSYSEFTGKIPEEFITIDEIVVRMS